MAGFVSKTALKAQVNELQNSKKAFLARLNGSPSSFAVFGPVSDVVQQGVITTFVVGGDVMRVTVDAMGDQATLEPIRRSKQLSPVVVPLSNETVEADFTPETAKKVYQTYQLFTHGPRPSGEELAAALNGHVAR